MGLIPEFDEDPEDVGRTVYLPATIWERLSQIAEETKAMDPKHKGYSRNKLIKHALRDYVERWDLARGDKKRK